MKINFTYAIIIAFVSLNISCRSNKLDGLETDGMTLVTVRDFRTLDGCGFILEKKDGGFLQPINLDSTFQQEGMVLGITFKTSKTPTVCMKGIPVDLLKVNRKSK